MSTFIKKNPLKIGILPILMKSDTKSNVDLMARKVALRKVLVEDYWSGGGRSAALWLKIF